MRSRTLVIALALSSLPLGCKREAKPGAEAEGSGAAPATEAAKASAEADPAADGESAAKAQAPIVPEALRPSASPKKSPDDIDLISIPGSPQPKGDPKAGYRALLEVGYVGCGMPWSLAADRMGTVRENLRIADRAGKNKDIWYHSTIMTTPAGVEVVTQNCLVCHGGFLDGKLVIGLGNYESDMTRGPRLPPRIAGLGLEGAEREEFVRWLSRTQSLGEHMQTKARGVNSADTIAAVLFSHRDPATLAWLDEPAIPLPQWTLPLDVPPWWHVKKKHALYYTAAGRGDFSPLMMLASVLCVDSVEHATDLAKHFPDIRAYIESIEAPPYDQLDEVDRALAAKGEDLFEVRCAECHGTYGATDADDTYPNVVVPIDDLGTDPLLAREGSFYSDAYQAWYKASFFGKTSQLEPENGYIAPPLDGIWATAPYLHNGSVPTVRAVLDSRSRPTYWRRLDEYDRENLGWRYETTGSHADAAEDERGSIYDTTEVGYANAGHLFGDELSGDERDAIIEYLKTL